MQFVLGLVLGAVLGVIADRLWSRFEQIPRLDVIGSFFVSLDGDGFIFAITNRGRWEIPPVKICIYNPNRGSIFMFEKDKEGMQLPGQKIEHRCLVLRNKKLLRQYPDLYRKPNGKPLSEMEKNAFVFRLVLENSERVIYENKSLGNSFVNVFQKVRDEKTFEGITFDEAMSMQWKYEPWYGKVLKRVRIKLGG